MVRSSWMESPRGAAVAPAAPQPTDREFSRLIERWAYDTPRADEQPQVLKIQKTRWVYGPPKGADPERSEIASGALLWKICYPHPETGEAQFDPGNPNLPAHSAYQVTFVYNRQAQLKWKRTRAYM